MLEKLSDKKFAGEVLLDSQAQQVFGGQQVWTISASYHYDRWNDWDDDFSFGIGDTLTIYKVSPPPSPGPGPGEVVVSVTQTEEQLTEMGVMVTIL